MVADLPGDARQERGMMPSWDHGPHRSSLEGPGTVHGGYILARLSAKHRHPLTW